MKFAAKVGNTERLTFNDLGKDVRGVAPEEKHIALDPGESIYMLNSSGVLYSAMAGDARRYEDNNLLDINDIVTLANNAELTIVHNFKFVPPIFVAKKVAGNWVGATPGTDYTATTNAALTQTVVKNISGGPLDFYVNIG